MVSLAALAGLWFSAIRAERIELDRADAGIARSAAAYLSVVVPAGAANGYDPARLLAAVNNLERATFWPGGIQLSLGSVPLLPDTIGLVPVPDSLLKRLDEGRDAVFADYPSHRTALVPFLDRDRFGMLGWTAVWGTVVPQLPSGSSLLTALVAAGFILFAAVSFAKRTDARWRVLYLVCALGFTLVFGIGLGWAVARVARSAAEVRVLTLKRLVEVAATAPGVRQAMLPEIAVGVRVRPLNQVSAAESDVGWREGPEGKTVTAIAAAPRTQSALELTLRPESENLSRLTWLLAVWTGVGILGLAITAGGGRYSSNPPADRVPSHGEA
jgi:hypothetical protein